MSARTAKPAAPLVLAAGLALLVLCALVSIADTVLPAPGLDPSWQLAVEYAASHRMVFGRDVIFTYGPYHYLATHLFDPATYPLVLVYQLLTVLAAFWIALSHRSLLALLAVGVALILPQATRDSFNTLALFAAFLICLQRRDLWCVLVVALCAPLTLAKYSFGLVILPLLLLADLDRLTARRAPVLTLAFGAAFLVANALAGQPTGALGELLRNTLEVVMGYGRAMQITGPISELAATVLVTGLGLALVAILAWPRNTDEPGAPRDPRPAIAALGYAWVTFLLFKMGFVRQDSHPITVYEAAPAVLGVAFAFLDRPGRLGPASRIAFVVVFAATLANAVYWRGQATRVGVDPPLREAQTPRQLADGVLPRLETGLAWAAGSRFGEMKRQRAGLLASLERDFDPVVTGRVDAVPYDLSPLIGSGLTYQPRPVIQSYSSYTPVLQALDRAHFMGPDAPDTLFLRIDDIDARLPTLALGPSLPVIGRRYDAVGSDELGLVLRRRETPRAAHAVAGPVLPLQLDHWSSTPGAPGRLVMAHITVERTLAGRIVGFLFREPIMRIDLRTASGEVTSHRFIPDMARLGVAISPQPKLGDVAALSLLDPDASVAGEPVTAIRIVTNGKNWAFGRMSVSYEQISFAPGFGGKMPAMVAGSTDYAKLLADLRLLEGDHIKPRHLKRATTEADPKLCLGWLDELRPSVGGPKLWEARGWGWDATAGRVFDRILLVDNDGQLVGAALSGQARADVPAAVPEVRSTTAGWKGVALRQSAGVTAYGVLADGRACPLGRKDWP